MTASVEHAAPEILAGQKPSVASDVYSAASTIFALMYGTSAFRRSTDESVVPMINRVLNEDVPDLRARGVPDAVATVIEQAMAKEPSKRPRSAREFADALKEAVASLAPAHVPTTGKTTDLIPDELKLEESKIEESRRGLLVAGAVGMAVIAAVASVALVLNNGGNDNGVDAVSTSDTVPQPTAAPATSPPPTTIALPDTTVVPVLQDKIAFVSGREGNLEIYVINADGSNPTRLTNSTANYADAYADNPAWSSDGSKIAFESNRDGNPEIYVMNAEGSTPIRLTDGTARDGRPAWSQDGSRIAFESDRDGNFEIYVMDADGFNPTRLTKTVASEFSPAWSPDGSKIAFQSDRSGAGEIYVMDADGTNPIRLTTPSPTKYR